MSKATVVDVIDDSQTQYLASQGYLYTVIVEDEDDDDDGVTDLVDFKNEFGARTYADYINIQAGE